MRKFASVTILIFHLGPAKVSHVPSFHCLQYEGGESGQGMGVEESGIEPGQDTLVGIISGHCALV